MNLAELRTLDPNKPGTWPLPVRLVVILLVLAGLLFAGYWFVVKDQLASLERAKSQEPDLRRTFEVKQRKAASLPAYQAQMDEAQEKFGTLLEQLPNKSEIANLLQEVSQTRLAAGLEENLFKPGGESNKDFYAELPVKIELEGSFHDFGDYAAGIAALPRIVTLNNMSLEPLGKGRRAEKNSPKADPQMRLSLTAKTYRYLEEQ